MLGTHLHVCRSECRNSVMAEWLNGGMPSRYIPGSQAVSPIILNANPGHGAVDFVFSLAIKHFAACNVKSSKLNCVNEVEVRLNGPRCRLTEVHYAYAPLYQNMLPSSWGPCIILHVRFMSLPVFTIKSLGPKISALSSAKKKAQQEEKFKIRNETENKKSLKLAVHKAKSFPSFP